MIDKNISDMEKDYQFLDKARQEIFRKDDPEASDMMYQHYSTKVSQGL